MDPISVGLSGEEDLLEILDTLPNGIDRVVLPHQEGAVVAVDRQVPPVIIRVLSLKMDIIIAYFFLVCHRPIAVA